MAEIINLDELLPPPKKVELDGKVYKLPSEIPVPLYLRLVERERATRAGGDEQDLIADVHEQCLTLFQVYQPEVEELPVGIIQLLKIIPRVYGGEDLVEAEAPKRRTRARTGSGNTRAKPKTKSRS